MTGFSDLLPANLKTLLKEVWQEMTAALMEAVEARKGAPNIVYQQLCQFLTDVKVGKLHEVEIAFKHLRQRAATIIKLLKGQVDPRKSFMPTPTCAPFISPPRISFQFHRMYADS